MDTSTTPTPEHIKAAAIRAALPPITVRLMFCEACDIHTNHRLTRTTGEWYCWCGTVAQPEPVEVVQ